MKKIFLTVIIIFTMSAPVFVSAQGLKGALKNLEKIGGVDGEKIGVSADLATTVATVIKTVLALVGTIFLVLTIYAGILWMTAQGNEEQVTKAVGIIKASVIGLVIIMSAYAITYFVTSKLSSTSQSQSGPSTVCSGRISRPACESDGYCQWVDPDPSDPLVEPTCENK